ncbi:MAG: hypothetical protein V4539_11195 [Bacteroidota bacterium]
MLQKNGYNVEVAVFDRDNYKPREIHTAYTVLGNISHGDYGRRLRVFLQAIPKLRRLVKQNDLVYSSGLDMLFLSVISSLFLKKKQVVEVGDIREIQVDKSWKGKIYRKIENWFLKRTHLVVVTSSAFLSEYFHGYHSYKIKGLVLENKLDMDLSIRETFLPQQKPVGEKIRIGYFGLLRCKWSLKVLTQLVKNYGDRFEVVLAGLITHQNEHDEIVALDNTSYLGLYKSPDDLSAIYANVDMIWACYQPFEENDYNLRWARPNRFYESCFFGKPLFTRNGCQDAFEVKKLNIGYLIDDSDPEITSGKIATITNDNFNIWQNNILSLPPDIFVYTREDLELKETIDHLFN